MIFKKDSLQPKKTGLLSVAYCTERRILEYALATSTQRLQFSAVPEKLYRRAKTTSEWLQWVHENVKCVYLCKLVDGYSADALIPQTHMMDIQVGVQLGMKLEWNTRGEERENAKDSGPAANN